MSETEGKIQIPKYRSQVGEDEFEMVLSRDPAYSVSHLRTRNTAVMMQSTHAILSDLPKRVIQNQQETQHSLLIVYNDAPGQSSGADLLVIRCNCRASVRFSEHSGTSLD